MSTQTFN